MGITSQIIFLSYILFSILISISSAVDTITGNQTIRDDGNNTIESAGGIFELGFFSPGRSTNRYLGIWYKKIPNKTVVWVANRETPLADNSGVLRIQEQGNLVLKDAKGNIVWSTNNSSSTSVMNLVAQLSDDGNFVLRNSNDSNSENFIWQSFDYPGDTILPGMKLGWDFVNGLNKNLTSWKSGDDPSRGNYTAVVDLKGYPRVLVFNGLNLQFRFGPWDGVQFTGFYVPDPIASFTATAIMDKQGVYFKFDLSDSSVVMRVVLTLNGKFQILSWIDQTQSWSVYLDSRRDVCDQYARCGEYGICNQSRCECLTGFVPKSPDKWDSGDLSDGCARKTNLCQTGDTFKKYSGLKFPDTRNSWFDTRMTLEDCRRRCLSNCSCTAYSNIDIRMGGTGCLLWFDNLTDIRNFINGLDLYVKVAASDLPAAKSSSGGKSRVTIIVVAVLLALAALLALFLLIAYRKKMLRRKEEIVLPNSERLNQESDAAKEKEGEDLDLPLFDFVTIANATNNFSENNKLGEGGFGPVYKGVLNEGQEIAVKRLSKDSRQGLDEFKNEVSCIAKLQHRNLVRLLGCCIKEKELLLIYEYMPNKSLDSIIFDKEQSKLMDWPKCYNIIKGIARGLLYLHQDSRLRIIHRDLKASNILLDYEMNPRISDFGMARTFGGNESEANTTRVVGTFGYMSPEYAFEGIFSFKSDVYSFGVLLLEIVSGMKMRGFYNSDLNLNLLSHAWKVYKEGKFMELINSAFVESCNQSEVFRAIQIGLLCVQPYPDDRPSMLSVVLMLSSEIKVPQPKEPSFFNDKIPQESDISSSKMSDASTSNKLTITDFSTR